MTAAAWGGRAVTNERAYWATLLPMPCARCGRTIHPDKPGAKRSGWVLGHKQPRATHPELTWVRANMQLEHKRCSDRTGVATVIAKARLEGAAGVPAPRVSGAGGGTESRRPSRGTPPSHPESPVFDPEWLQEAPWMTDLLAIPGDSSWPRAMSPPHPDATGSYGLAVEAWVREELGVELRWWQRLACRRQLEHDDQGRLVWQNVLESTPRRAGKSVRLRSTALWRVANSELFGEQQLVLHTGKDLPICKEIHRRAWRWAEERGWLVRRQNGNEEIERPDGSRWLVRGRTSVYGYDVCYGMVDEAWDVEATVVDDGLEPAMLERSMPQLLLTSTAHRRATSLMRRRLESALAGLGEDFDTLLLWWGAGQDTDPGDQVAWRAASPHWTEQRRDMIAGKFERAMRGEADPDADDPDPLEAFKAQYLNIWPPAYQPRAEPGVPVVTVSEWEELGPVARPGVAPAVVAVESWFGRGVSVGSAWPLPNGRVLVSVAGFSSVKDAAAAALSAGAQAVLVGKSLVGDPAWVGAGVVAMTGVTRQAVVSLRQLVDEGVLVHDGSEELAGQVLGLRSVNGVDGPRVRSGGRADAVKTAVWAAEAARLALEAPAVF